MLYFFGFKSEICAFLVHISDQRAYFLVEPYDLYFRSYELVVLVECQTTRRLGPGFTANITSGVTEELKVGEKGIVEDFFPSQLGTVQLRCSFVVGGNGRTNGLGSRLEGLGNMFPKFVSC